MKRASTATDREWFEAVVSRVRQVAALERSGRSRTIDESRRQQPILQQCSTDMAVLLLAWSAVVEARERDETVADRQTAPAGNDGRER
jgi:hypothetical protein